ncbi:phosphoribosylformylglycinamidine cyclo-ligase [Hordeum vulgare]|nr:phosphoribosylformylglycinamidine cyclo-ligase [Hordeum vulgare]
MRIGRVHTKKAYMCGDCGYIYKEKTPFEKLSNDYYCPGDEYLVAGTYGIGTKLKLAFETGIHDTIGIDLVIEGIVHGCQQSNCILLGGEFTDSLDDAVLQFNNRTISQVNISTAVLWE